MILMALLATPLLAGAAAFVRPTRRWMESVNLLCFAAGFLLSAGLAAQVLESGPVTMWDAFLYADHLSALVVLLVTTSALACTVYAVGYFRHDERNLDDAIPDGIGKMSRLRLYYTLTPLFVFAMILVALAHNLGVMWVAIEGTTLASVFLVAFYGKPTSLEAGWKYVIIGSVGLSMALFGTILTYYAAHRDLNIETLAGLNWSVLAANAGQFNPTVMRLAFILLLLGYGTKAGIAPMHTWKPDAYSEAPVPTAALLASALLNCAVYALARFQVLAVKSLGPHFATQLMILFGLLSVGIAVPFIIAQRSYRRLLAYSSIDHGGIMLLGLGFGGPLGTLGALLHMTYHSMTKPLLFFCAGNIQQQSGTDVIRRLRGGVLRAMPLSGGMLLMAALAVTGSPPFSLFQSEFTILRAGFESHHVLPAILLVVFLSAIFAGFLVHISRVVLTPAEGATEKAETCPWKRGSVAALGMAVIVIAFWLPAPLAELIQGAALIVQGER